MAIAVLSVPHFLGPLQALWARATQPQAVGTPRQRMRAAQAAPAAAAPVRAYRAGPLPAVRVVRVIDPGQSRGGAGRMVISGRMADVCAELERLAAREAQQRQESDRGAQPALAAAPAR